ncbi:MAG: sulfatase [Myxococcota bacterium]
MIVIVMDTTRADRLGPYGSERATTPRIDAFVRDCEVYDRAWSTSSWTLPAHASMLTGLYPTRHGAYNRPDRDPDSLGKNPPRLADSFETLAERLAAHGYHTAAFAGAGWLAPEFGLLQGYAVQDAENLRDIPAEELTTRALAWLDGVPPDEPLHLLVNYFDPHGPYEPPEGYDVFPGAKDPPPAKLDPAALAKLTAEQLAVEFGKIMGPTLARYDGEILYTDDQIGRLLDHLRELGRYDEALIFIVADHGEGFGGHGVLGHGAWLYETVLRIPFIVHRPGGRGAGTRVVAPVSLVDMLPIVAEETGLELPADLDAVPVGERTLVLAEEMPSALFKKRMKRLDRDLVAGIRWPFKLILNFPGPRELYRLDRDPREGENLADGAREAELEQRVLQAVSALEPAAAPEAPRPMSDTARERLRSLGYIE